MKEIGSLAIFCIMMLSGCVSSESANNKPDIKQNHALDKTRINKSDNRQNHYWYSTKNFTWEKFQNLGRILNKDLEFKVFFETSIKPSNYKHFVDTNSREKSIGQIVDVFGQYCSDRNGIVGLRDFRFLSTTHYFCTNQEQATIGHISIHLDSKKAPFSFHTAYAGIFNDITARTFAVGSHPLENMNYPEMVRFEGEIRIGNLLGKHIASQLKPDRADDQKTQSYLVESLEARKKINENFVSGAVLTSLMSVSFNRDRAMPSEIAALLIVFKKVHILLNNGYRVNTSLETVFQYMTREKNPSLITKLKIEPGYELVLKRKTGEEIIYQMVEDNKNQLVFLSNKSTFSKVELQDFIDESLDQYHKGMWESLDRKFKEEIEKERKEKEEKAFKIALDAHRKVLVPDFQGQVLCKTVILKEINAKNSISSMYPARFQGIMKSFSSDGYKVQVETLGFKLDSFSPNTLTHNYRYGSHRVDVGSVFWDSIAGWKSCN
jgi:hypothetical protein